MKTNLVTICCEGPACNANTSARERESVLESRSGAMTIREEFARAARSAVSHTLRITPHVRVGPGPLGALMFRCTQCEHVRQYGNTF